MGRVKRILSLVLVIALIFMELPTDVLAKNMNTKGGVADRAEESSNTEALTSDIFSLSTEQKFEAKFKITSQWPGSFNGEITLKNTGTEPIENWALEFKLDHQIINIWNAYIFEQQDDVYIIKNKGWNANINPGKEISIGFTAYWNETVKVPEDYRICSQRKEVSQEDYTVVFNNKNDWGSGFNGEIRITNNTEKAMEHWNLEFDFNHKVTNFWDAKQISIIDNHYRIQHAGYNSIIEPGKTLTIGFGGSPGNVITGPENYRLSVIEIVSSTQVESSPTVQISASPENITKGESTQLIWSTTDADMVIIDQGIGSAVTGGAITVTPVETTTYTITATAHGTTATATASVTVIVSEVTAPEVQIMATPQAIYKGETVYLTWLSKGGQVAHIDNGIGSVELNGTYAVSPEYTTTYAITVSGDNGTSNATIVVKVLGDPLPQPEGSFGYQYQDLIPEDATVESYDEDRFSLITGSVQGINNEPLEGVFVSAYNHPEYGTVSSDVEGKFTLPVEGGGDFILEYSKKSYITSMRSVYVPWNDTAITETLQMLTEDSANTTLTFDNNPDTITTHQSTPITDEFGTRSLSMVFQGDNKAWLVDENGNDVYPLETITVRATEFVTPESMPSVLPSTSAYTYCAELQVDGAERVRFEKPVVTWVDNFLEFPVGEAVPAGYFDRDRNLWVPSKDGLVVMLLDTNGDGIVDAMDTDGDLEADVTDPEQLLGLEDSSIYKPGNTYWRIELTHFTPWDFNWPYGPPMGATAPNSAGVPQNQHNMVFYEDIEIPGTNNALHYASDRVEGYKTMITVPVSGASVPDSLESITVELKIAGRTFTRTLSPEANQITEFEWDGLDHLGREINRTAIAKIRIGFTYQSYYYNSSDSWANSFAMAGAARMLIGSRQKITIWKASNLTIEPKKTIDSYGEGWSITSNHQLLLGQDRMLLRGDGSTAPYTDITLNESLTYFDDQILPCAIPNLVKEITNNSTDEPISYGSDPYGIVIDASGDIYTTTNNRVVKVDSDGNKTVIAGNGIYGFSGDGGPATEASFRNLGGIAIDRDGNIYVADSENQRIRKIDTNGVITTIAGNGESNEVEVGETLLAVVNEVIIDDEDTIGDNGPAVDAILNYPNDVAIDSFGYLYISDSNRIRKVDPNGTITTVAGNGDYAFYGDNGPANEAALCEPMGIVLDAAGNLYIADSYNGRIRKVNQSGIITTVAGNGTYESFDGVPAVESGIGYPEDVAVDSNGHLYIASPSNNVIRKVYPDGIISTVAGVYTEYQTGLLSVTASGQRNESGERESSPALLTPLSNPSGIAVNASGSLYIADTYANRISKISLPYAFIADTMEDAAYVFIDGDVFYTFSSTGLHQKTIDLATDVTLLEFTYNEDNQLISMCDQLGNQVDIERDVNGTAKTIISPYGIRTELNIENNKLSQVIYPNGADYTYSYTQNGLLTQVLDFNKNLYQSGYDQNGRLTSILDSEGGLWKYDKIILPSGDNITKITSAEGLVTTYTESQEFSGAYHMTIKEPTGVETVQSQSAGSLGMNESLPDGTAFSYQYNLDPRYYTEYTDTVTMDTPLDSDITYQNNIYYEDIDSDGKPDIITTTNTDNSRTSTTVHNILEATITTTTPENRTAIVAYNPDTLLIERQDVPGLASTYYENDARGRLRYLRTGTRVTEFQYNQTGFLSKVVTPDQKETTYEYNSVGQITELHRADGTTIYQEYDNNGNLTKLVAPGRAEHMYDYNKVDSTVQYQTPISGDYRYTYNKDRQMTSITTPAERQTSYLYENGQLVQVETPEGDTIYMEYLDDTLLEKIRKNEETITYDYVGSLVTKETRDGVLDTALEITYNEDLNIETFTYAGQTESYNYDDDGLLTKTGRFDLTRNQENGLLEATGDGTAVIQKDYSGFGELETTTYQIAGRTSLTWSLQRDISGKITQKTEVLDGVTTTFGYTYDDLGRLLTVTKNGILTEQYQYDLVGRRTSATNHDRDITGINYTYSEEDQLLSAGNTQYEYDLDGYLTKKIVGTDETTYNYSSGGELLKVVMPEGTEIEYFHDALGRKVAKVVNGEIIEKYLWADENVSLLAVYDGNDNLKIRFEYAEDLRPTSMVKDGIRYYLTYDQVNSLRAITDTSGNVVKRIDYDSFGNILNDTNEAFKVPIGFAGGYHDRDTGLVRFGARDYNPDTGRWTSKDPLSFNSGDTDLYGYCFNDPVSFVDMDGNLPEVQKGYDFMKQIYDTYIGFVKNNDSFRTAYGYRIPDFMNKVVVGEIKNVMYQCYTSQIKGFIEIAKDKGRIFVLVISEGTKLSKPLIRAIDEAKGKIVIIASKSKGVKFRSMSFFITNQQLEFFIELQRGTYQDPTYFNKGQMY